MKKIFLTVIAIFALAASVLIPNFVFAAAPTGIKAAGGFLDKVAGAGSGTGLSGDFAGTVATVIKTVLALVGTVFLVLTIYAGILWMTAQGEEEKVTKARDVIKASVLGLIVIMSAYAFTAFVTSRLTGATTAPAVAEDPTGCCYATATSDGHCTPSSGVHKSECERLYEDTGSIRGSWVAGSCQAVCPRVIDF